MPRFRLTSVLIGLAAVALWFSTFAGYSGSEDVRAFILLSIFICSGVAAYSFTDRRRAFWLGFFGTMFMAADRSMFTTLGANFQWLQKLSREWGLLIPVEPIGRGRSVIAVHATIFWGVTIAVAVIIGLLCVKVYDSGRKTENPKSEKS